MTVLAIVLVLAVCYWALLIRLVNAGRAEMRRKDLEAAMLRVGVQLAAMQTAFLALQPAIRDAGEAVLVLGRVMAEAMKGDDGQAIETSA